MKPRAKIAIVLGTRPELIKLAPVIRHLSKSDWCETEVIFTNQHRELLAGLVELFEIPVTTQLNLQHQSQGLSQLTSQLISQLGDHFSTSKKCDAIIVQGDTTTAFAAGVVGFYQHIPVAHVEAGLRTGDLQQPFPEEFNRQVISKIATWNFSPTKEADDNLVSDGIQKTSIHRVGNTVVDALQFVRKSKIPANYFESTLQLESPELYAALKNISSQKKVTKALMTVHRRESQGADQERVFTCIRDFAIAHPTHHFIYPYHLNPKVKSAAFQILSDLENIHLIPPISYRPMIYLMGTVDFVVSDSGGIQEEIPAFNKPLLILRNRTERPEIVSEGYAKLVGQDVELLRKMMTELVQTSANNTQPKWFQPKSKNPFGDGLAAEKIAQILKADLEVQNIKSEAA